MNTDIITERSGHEADEMVVAYRADHRIEPVEVASIVGRVRVCDHCRIRVYRIVGGWRHDQSEIAALVAAAPLAGVR